jgi:ATP-dependent RNA helicase SUPV3L1/SUV3
VPIVPDAEIVPGTEPQISPAEAPAAEVEAPQAESGDEPAPAVVAEAQQAPANEPAGDEAKEPEMIEVWRPGRRSDERRESSRPSRRGRRERRGPARDRHVTAETPSSAPADSAVATGASAEPSTPDDQPRRRRSDRPPRRDAEGRADGDQRRDDRPPRRDREQRGGDRPPRRDRDQRRPFQMRAPAADRRDKQPDPNSPFAKLAALKEQLEAADKERR